jgi:hypothetical protein
VRVAVETTLIYGDLRGKERDLGPKQIFDFLPDVEFSDTHNQSSHNYFTPNRLPSEAAAKFGYFTWE